MKTFNRVFLAALLAGGLAGLFLTCIQQFTVMPMIFEAETYETSSANEHDDHHASSNSHNETSNHHEHNADAWSPKDGAERTFYTALNSILVAVGFGLILTALYSLRGKVTWKAGIIWGLAGFIAVNLAPSLGLPPELPGDTAADITDRQIWWLLTVVSTAIGLWMIAFSSNIYLKFLALIVIALPHIIGAPQPEIHESLAPADLRQSFIYTSLITNAIFWTLLGTLCAIFYIQFNNDENNNLSISNSQQ